MQLARKPTTGKHGGALRLKITLDGRHTLKRKIRHAHAGEIPASPGARRRPCRPERDGREVFDHQLVIKSPCHGAADEYDRRRVPPAPRAFQPIRMASGFTKVSPRFFRVHSFPSSPRYRQLPASIVNFCLKPVPHGRKPRPAPFAALPCRGIDSRSGLSGLIEITRLAIMPGRTEKENENDEHEKRNR